MLYNDIAIIPPIIAHRGRSALAPENTMIAFQKAKECGLTWVEFDVTLAACGEAVIIHDDSLQRTAQIVGNVHDFSYEYLKSLDAGSWFGVAFAGEKIPTLQEVLAFLKKNQMAANIEVKSYPGKETSVIKKILQVIETCDIPLLLTSFSKTMLKEVRLQHSQIPLGFLMDTWDETYPEFCNDISAMNIGIDHHLLSAERVKQLKSTGRLLTAYTVNDVARAKELFSFGVDAIFSDYPEIMRINFS